MRRSLSSGSPQTSCGPFWLEKTWLPEVKKSTPAACRSAMMGLVSPLPWARFSALTIVRSGLNSSFKRGSARLSASRPILPTTSPKMRNVIICGLAGVLDRAHLADDVDLDLAGVLELLLALLGDVLGELPGAEVVDALGGDEDADLAAGLDGVGAVDGFERGRDLLEVLEAADVVLERVLAGAGARSGDGVGGLAEVALDVARPVLVVRERVVGDVLGEAELLHDVVADLWVGAGDVVVDGLADVVEEPA